MSEFSPSSLLNLLQNSIPSKKEEIQLLEYIINNFNQESNLPNEYLQIYNNLIETRIELIKEAEPDFLYILKVSQAIRVLSRSQEIQKIMFNEKHINILFNVLNQLHNIQKSNNKNIKIIENIIIELFTILKRFIYPVIQNIEKEKEKFFFNLIANNSNVIIIMIELIENKNVVLLKLFKYLLKKLLVSYNVEMNFCKTKSVEILINNLNIENDSEVIELTLDIIFLLLDKIDFVKLFIILDGFSNQLINLLKNFKKYSSELISKILHISNLLCKNEDNLENCIDIKIINDLYEILKETIDSNFLISKNILNIFSAFCINNEINILLRINYLKNFFILLLDLNIKLKENDKNNNSNKNLILNEILIIRILRFMYSLDYNKKYFKNYFTKKILLDLFIQIGDYKSSVNCYDKFIEIFNKLNLEEIIYMKKTINSINTTPLINNNNNIGGFEILEMIGKGGFGSVFKVKKNSKIYAMKIIGIEIKQFLNIKEIINNKENIENAFSEIKIWKKLNHGNFVKYHLAFIENNKCYIIMEYIDGLTLGEYINHLKETNQKISKKFMIEILCQIVSGLRYMKNNKIIYKDLNPNNILIYSKNKIKLIDFGLAIDLNLPRNNNNEKEKLNVINQSVSPEFEGSIFYSSPEVMNNELIDYSSDIWALGCILYEMIKLKPPFNGDNPLTIAKNICDLKFDEKLNKEECNCDEIYEIIMRSLVVNPRERISIEEICKLLGEYVFDKLDIENELNANLKKENASLKKIIEKLKEKK